jgi:hypothetical protein
MAIRLGGLSSLFPFCTQCLSSGLLLSTYSWSICIECAEDFTHSSSIRLWRWCCSRMPSLRFSGSAPRLCLPDPCKKTDLGSFNSPALAPPPGASYLTATMPSILRERNPLSALTDPKTNIAPGERDIRMEDYVNDKIQTVADLEDIESLIAAVEINHKLLEEQVSNAPRSFYICN